MKNNQYTDRAEQIPVGHTHIFGTILEKATVDFSRTNAKTIFFFFLITGGWTKGIRLLDWGTKLLPLFLLSWDDYLKVQINHPSLPPPRNSGALEI